jgi:transposase InsO family protein
VFVHALNRHAMIGLDGQSRRGRRQRSAGELLLVLQKKVLDRRSWATREELRIAIVRWIERTYHRRRRQAALGRLTPVGYELTMTPTAIQAA